MSTLNRTNWILLCLLTISWGINWPIMKIGVQDFPPLTFRALGMLGGLPVLWLVARMQGISLALPKEHLTSVIRLAIPNMLVWHVFIIYGVKLLSSGRAAILGFTMPAWTVLFGVLLYRQHIARLEWLGILCAVSGTLLLLSSEFSALSGQPLGSLLVLIAAAGWGYGTVAMKRTTLSLPTLALTFWMLAFSALVLSLAAMLFEADQWRMPGTSAGLAIVYNGIIVFGFAHAVWFHLARTLPPVVSGLSVMMIPVLGVFSGAWLLDETPQWQDYGAMLLILAAMSTVLLKPNRPNLSE